MPIIDTSRNHFKFSVTVTIPVPTVRLTIPSLGEIPGLNAVLAKIVAAAAWFGRLVAKLALWIAKLVDLVKRLLRSIPEASVRLRLRTAPYTVPPFPLEFNLGLPRLVE